VKNNKIIYVQVCYELTQENYHREVGNLLKINDNNRKIIISYHDNDKIESSGVEIINILTFLKSNEF
jgi:predicted AAA+ superfamily ATPase